LIHKKADLTTLSGYSYTLKADGSRQSVNESLQEDRNITYGYDNLNRLKTETAAAASGSYNVTYEYDLAGNRTERHITANSQLLDTEYQYYTGTDRLEKEIHTEPASRLDNGNEIYYAYANPAGKGFYYRDSSGKVVGAVRAFFAGLPNVWSQWLLGIVSAFLVIAFFVPNLLLRRTKQRLGFFHRGMCCLIAWIMFVSPELFNQLSESAVQYSQVGRSSWGQADRTITYTYDANGSVLTKITTVTSNSTVLESVTNHYNLAGRLDKVTTEDSDGDERIVEYTYNDQGIRVKAYSYDIPYQGSAENHKTIVYLTDSYNHTGYAQTLEELTFNKANPDLQTDTPDSVRTYLIGDDVISQATEGTETTEYLLYDGHGSTRQLAGYSAGSVTIADSYSYDGYGVFLQPDYDLTQSAVRTPTKQTNLLYAGEHFDEDSQQYYNRARWYNPLSGLFNQLDPYAGNTSDPQSLHKYLYCHANPVNGIDPTGQNMTSVITVAIVVTILMFILSSPNVVNAPSSEARYRDRSGDMIVDVFICIALVPAMVYGKYLIKNIFRIGKPHRLPQDVSVNPKPPEVKPLERPIGKSPTQNARLQEDIRQLKAQGYTDFRVNQQQVNSKNVRVGVNQPDLQCTSPQNQRLYMEYDTPVSPRGPIHKQRILSNDTEGTVILIKQK